MSRRKYPKHPIVGVGVLINDGDNFLLIKRAAEPDAGLWSIPGGIVEVGERVEEAAIREAEEETGLKVELCERIGVVDKIIKDLNGEMKYHFIIIDFLARPISGNMKAMDDALDAVWVKNSEFKDYNLTPTFVELLEELELLDY
ncbi:NUDIX domain-containing protein [Candidatus Bathyarchaeota archaeon]|nr:NUDIX domain-containing protein [Candidatus Bathyarchaeota archaeon]